MTNEEISGYSLRISQASRTELIVIMYDMAENYLRDGIRALEAGEPEEFRHNLKRAQRVVNQLTGALDMAYEISLELMRLYAYIANIIIRASIRKDTPELNTVFFIIDRLRKAFEQVSRQDNSGPVMKNAQQVFLGLTYSNGKLTEYQDDSTKRGFTV